MIRRLFVSAALLAFARPATAQEPSKAECVAAFERGQEQNLEGQLVEARETLATCTASACPGIVREECGRVLEQAEAGIATVTFSATDDQGNQLTEVEVSIDGKTVVSRLDGRAQSINPGQHSFRFEIPGSDPILKNLTIAEGEKLKRIEVVFGDSEAGLPSESVALSTDEAPDRTLAYVFGGTAAAGIAGFAIAGSLGLKQQNDLDDQDCKPGCDSGDVDKARRRYLAADIMLGVGVVSAGLAAYFFFRKPPSESPKRGARRGVRFDAGATRHGGQAWLRGTF